MTPRDPVFLLEPNPEGHRLFYVRVLAEADLSRPLIWLTTPEAARSAQARVHLGDLDPRRLRVRTVEWERPGRVLAHLAGRDVVIPDGDRWLPALATQRRRRPRSVRLLLMRPPAALRVDAGHRARRLKAVGKSALARAACARQRGDVQVWTLSDPFGYSAVDSGWLPAVPDPVLPRAVPERAWARARLGIRADTQVVGLLGRIDLRKNPGLVAAAVAQRPAHLLVAGELTADARRALERSGLPQDRLTLRDGYLAEDELVTAAAACDVVAALYGNHQSSSGIVALAAQAGAAVVVPGGGLLERVARAGGFGTVAPSLSTADVVRALSEADALRTDLTQAARAAARRLGSRRFQAALLSAV